MTNFEELKGLLNSPQKIVVTAHIRPDADALGSSLALGNYLIKKGHSVQVIMPTIYPRFLYWMKGHDDVLVYDNDKSTCVKELEEADIIFCLDFNALTRIGEMGTVVEKSTAKKVLMDHHLQPEGFADFEMSDTSAAATAVLVHDFISMMGDVELIDAPIGESIYAGIMTDTGSFRFPSTDKRVHLIIADLLDRGTNNTKVHRLIYDDNTESRLRFLGYCLSKCLTVIPELNTAFFILKKDDIAPFDIQTGDTEGMVNYALSIRGIVFAALFKQDEEFVKMSFRSKGSFSVNDFARNHFNGGGHKNAAGGRKKVSIDEISEEFQTLLPQYKEAIKESYNGLEK